MSPDWMNEETASQEGEVAFAKRPSPFKVTRSKGDPCITVTAVARGEVVPVLIRVPKETLARWKRVVRGGHTVAIAAAMELLLDDLEEAGEQISIEQA